jgi:hypothetical protein
MDFPTPPDRAREWLESDEGRRAILKMKEMGLTVDCTCPNCGSVHQDIGCTACGWIAPPSPAQPTAAQIAGEAAREVWNVFADALKPWGLAPIEAVIAHHIASLAAERDDLRVTARLLEQAGAQAIQRAEQAERERDAARGLVKELTQAMHEHADCMTCGDCLDLLSRAAEVGNG